MKRSSPPDHLGQHDVTYHTIIATPWEGVRLGLVMHDGALCQVDFLDASTATRSARDPILREVVARLQQYFLESRTPLDVPLALAGTEFQRRVWAALRRIPVGITRHYGDLARELGSSARAVGGACRANPVPVFVPCHRVVARHGQGGFMGQTEGAAARLKAALLAHEVAHPRDD